MFVVKSSDGSLFGPFTSTDGAELWATDNEDELGDWCIEEVHRAR